MATEIERKFTVHKKQLIPHLTTGFPIKQGYIQTVDKTVVRLRIMGERAFLTLKGETKSFTRAEFEYSIPISDAQEMLQTLCQSPIIEKVRYHITFENHLWEVDIFSGDNAGLIIAEVELQSEDEKVLLPPWIKAEVTGDRDYYNSSLLKNPYSRWK